MDKKEYIKTIVRDFFFITTLVNFVIFVLGSLFQPDAQFGYDAFLAPMIYAALSLIPAWITYSPHELTVKELIVRKAIQLAVIEVVLFLLGFGLNHLSAMEPLLIASFGVSVAVVYVLVHLIEWFTASKKAMMLTEELKAFQQRERSV